MRTRRICGIACLLLLGTITATTLAQDQWTREMFEELFVPPAPGWSVSEMQVRELKTFAQLSGIEGMFEMAGALSGRGVQGPSVRYQLSRVYRAGSRMIEAGIDSEDINTAGAALAAHGYGRSKEGKLVPLPPEQKPTPEQLLSKGVKPVEHSGHLAIQMTQGSATFLAVLLGKTGILALGCEHVECLADLDALMARVNLQRLDQFALFDHRKPVPKK